MPSVRANCSSKAGTNTTARWPKPTKLQLSLSSAHLRLLVEASPEKSRAAFENEQANASVHRAQIEKSSMHADALHAEVGRIEGLIEGISRAIEDPDTELSVVIRKNAERAELESYLRGVRFAIP